MTAKLFVHVGPMFSAKTTALINRYHQLSALGLGVACIKPSIDTRYNTHPSLTSHDGVQAPAYVVDPSQPQRIVTTIPQNTHTLLIDEVQFYAQSIVQTIKQLLNQNIHLVVAGLDLDSTGNGFGPTPELIKLAQKQGSVLYHTARCDGANCANPATMTYAKKSKDGNVVVVGAANLYGAACSDCHPSLNQS